MKNNGIVATSLTRRAFVGLGAAVSIGVLGGCSPADDCVHVVILDTGVADIEPLRPYRIRHEGPAPTRPHGTQVASIVAGVSDARMSRLPPERLRVTSVNIAGGGGLDVGSLIAGLHHAADLKADVINISMGLRHPSRDLEAAVIAADRAGALVVASAGNVRFLAPDYPARYGPALCVGAVDTAGNRYSLSPADGVDVTALGVDVPVIGLDGTVTRESGASLATAAITNEVAAQLLDKRISDPKQYSSPHGR